MRVVSMTVYDIRSQWRHGFYGVYILVCALYIILLHFIPSSYQETVTILLTFSDPSAVGLILAGGIVLLERDQGVHDSLFVTPLKLIEYLLAKVVSLALLSLLAAWVIHYVSIGPPGAPVHFSLGILLTSSLFTLLSIGVVVRSDTINGFILLSQLYALPFTLPLLGFFDIGNSFLFRWLPTEGSLLLLKYASEPITDWEVIYAYVILIVGNVLIFYWAHSSFRQRVLLRVGREV